MRIQMVEKYDLPSKSNSSHQTCLVWVTSLASYAHPKDSKKYDLSFRSSLLYRTCLVQITSSVPMQHSKEETTFDTPSFRLEINVI